MHMITSRDAGNAYATIQHPSLVKKKLTKLGSEETYSDIYVGS